MTWSLPSLAPGAARLESRGSAESVPAAESRREGEELITDVDWNWREIDDIITVSIVPANILLGDFWWTKNWVTLNLETVNPRPRDVQDFLILALMAVQHYRNKERNTMEHQDLVVCRPYQHCRETGCHNGLQDFLARFAFVGIFIIENVLHAIHFEFEVDNMVVPAVTPLPYVPGIAKGIWMDLEWWQIWSRDRMPELLMVLCTMSMSLYCWRNNYNNIISIRNSIKFEVDPFNCRCIYYMSAFKML